jgi:hypothetical protein
MSTSFKRVGLESVQGYPGQASAHATTITTTLNSMIKSVVEVQYFGPNAFNFKTQAGQLAEKWAEGFLTTFLNFTDAVTKSTTNISGSLGGNAVNNSFAADAIKAPAAEPDRGFVEVETTALDSLIGTVGGYFDAVRSEIDSHMRTVESLDWAGNAQQKAIGMAQQMTATLKESANTGQTSIVEFISKQITSVDEADV